jgi:myb proto-oncogene protein
VTRGHWRPFEDKKLRELVAQHGAQNWNLIAQQLGLGRSGTYMHKSIDLYIYTS